MSPMYATLTLVYLEENLYEIIGKKYKNIKTEFNRSWKNIPGWLFYILKIPTGNIMIRITNSKTYTLKQNSPWNKFKELPFLNILIKTKTAKLSQIFNRLSTIPSFKKYSPQKLHRSYLFHPST